MFKILVIEDDKDLNKTVCSFLNLYCEVSDDLTCVTGKK